MSAEIESYEAELRDAGQDPARLYMCAQGAIAHAKMVEVEREEIRGLGSMTMARWRATEAIAEELRDTLQAVRLLFADVLTTQSSELAKRIDAALVKR